MKGLKNTARHSQSCRYAQFYQIIWLLKTHFQPRLFLHPNEKKNHHHHEKKSRHQKGSWTKADRGWELWPYLAALHVRKSQESALTRTPALTRFLALGLLSVWGAGLGEKLPSLDSPQPGKLFYFHFACLWNVIFDLLWDIPFCGFSI